MSSPRKQSAHESRSLNVRIDVPLADPQLCEEIASRSRNSMTLYGYMEDGCIPNMYIIDECSVRFDVHGVHGVWSASRRPALT